MHEAFTPFLVQPMLSGSSRPTVDFCLPANTHPSQGIGYLVADELRRRMREEQAVNFNDRHAEPSSAAGALAPGDAVLAPRLVRIGRDVPSFRAHGCFSFLCQEGKRFFVTGFVLVYIKTRQRLAGCCYFSLFLIISSAIFGLALS